MKLLANSLRMLIDRQIVFEWLGAEKIGRVTSVHIPSWMEPEEYQVVVLVHEEGKYTIYADQVVRLEVR